MGGFQGGSARSPGHRGAGASGVARPARLQVCYALTSDGDDAYADMVRVSALLVRRLHRRVRIVLGVDERTAAVFERGAPALLELVDDVVTIRTGVASPGCRNRCVKVSLREHVRGAFVYLVAAVLNRDRASPAAYFPDWVGARYRELGWPAPLARYFNGGVLFVADTPRAHRFAAEYRDRWRRYVEHTGDYHDQPALNSALAASDLDLHVLPLTFNAMVSVAPCLARRARILHYFTKDGPPPADSLLGHLARCLRERGELDWPALRRARRCGRAWLRRDGEAGWDPRWKAPAEQYLEWAQRACEAQDREAFVRYLLERLRRRPASASSWRLVRALVRGDARPR
jgi:hypothetical protein